MKSSIKRRMNRREFIHTVSAALASTSIIPGSKVNAWEKPSGERPNVLFIFVDQFRADICIGYGEKKYKNINTPHLDHLAKQGVTFTHALSTSPKCTPFRGMLMTGKYPTHSGLMVNFVHASPEQNPNCIANIFAQAGYDTGFIGKWHLAAGGWKNPGKTEQPDITDNFVPPGPARLGFKYWAANNFHTDFNDYWYFQDENKKLYSNKYETDTQIDQAIEFMQERKDSKKPFFLMVAPHPPHPPLNPSHTPKGYLEKVTEDLEWTPNVPEDVREKRKLQLRCYLAMCQNIDDNMGRLMNFLDKSQLANNTIVIFTSDHGEMHGSHGRYAKKVPYAESVNIPLIIRWPRRIPPGKMISDLYTPMDHLPTLCGLCDLDVPPNIDGIDLKDVVLGKGYVSRKEVLMATYVSGYNTFTTGKPFLEWRGVHTGQYTYFKWIRCPEDSDTDEELYDNFRDPYQIKNLVHSENYKEKLNELRRKLKELLAEAHDDFLPGTSYVDWYNKDRYLIRTSLGLVKRSRS